MCFLWPAKARASALALLDFVKLHECLTAFSLQVSCNSNPSIRGCSSHNLSQSCSHFSPQELCLELAFSKAAQSPPILSCPWHGRTADTQCTSMPTFLRAGSSPS